MVTVRIADKPADMPALLRAAPAFARAIARPQLHPSGRARLEAAARGVLGLDAIEIYLAEDDGALVGGIGLLFAPLVWDPSRLMAEEVFFWCDSAAPATCALRLLRFALGRAQARAAHVFIMHVMTSSPTKLHGAVKRLGFEPLQTSYMRVC